MDKIFSIDGLDTNIYKFLTFKDLVSLRKVSKLNYEASSLFCNIILNRLINVYDSFKYQGVTYDIDDIDDIDDIELSGETYPMVHYYNLHYYYAEIEFMQNFVIDKRLYQTFITRLKEKKIDKTVRERKMRLKINSKISNYYEFMIMYQEKERSIKSEVRLEWTKVDGKWVDKIIEDTILIERLVDNYDYLKIF